MFKITSLRAADGGGAYRIDVRRDGAEKGKSFYILAAHQREHGFSKGEYPDAAYKVLCRLDAVCRGVRIEHCCVVNVLHAHFVSCSDSKKLNVYVCHVHCRKLRRKFANVSGMDTCVIYQTRYFYASIFG